MTAYGYLDLSLDDVTKGIAWKLGPDGLSPVGRVGWLPDISTNLSYIGVRGFQTLDGLPFNFIYQLETQIDVADTAGTGESNSNESNVVKGALTSRNSFIGLGSDAWGAIMVGKTDAPYKMSTARMNPFSGMFGDYQVIMATRAATIASSSVRGSTIRSGTNRRTGTASCLRSCTRPARTGPATATTLPRANPIVRAAMCRAAAALRR